MTQSENIRKNNTKKQGEYKKNTALILQGCIFTSTGSRFATDSPRLKYLNKSLISLSVKGMNVIARVESLFI